MTNRVGLREAGSVEIISLADHTVDFISTIEKKEVHRVHKWVRERRSKEWIKRHFRLLYAEHGFSMLIKVFCNEKFHSILFDAGISRAREKVGETKTLDYSIHEVSASIC